MAVDIGNSAIKWGLGRPGQSLHERPLAVGRVVMNAADADWPAAIAWPSPPAEVLIASVHRPAATGLQHYLQRKHPHLAPRWLQPADVPLGLEVRRPDRVGIDRLMSAWAAWLLAGAEMPTVSVDAGSAVTVDLVTDGCFRGGAILPGVLLMLDSMVQGTDLLPQVSPDIEAWPAQEIPGRDTVAAMRLGVRSAVVGGVERIIAEYAQRVDRSLQIVVTGGDAAWLGQALPRACQCIPDLILRSILHLPGVPAALASPAAQR
jgi:type III pantothenate kinase